MADFSKEFLDVEIKYSGRSDSIHVGRNDDPYELAEVFVATHPPLKANKVDVIANYILVQMEKFFGEEEFPMDNVSEAAISPSEENDRKPEENESFPPPRPSSGRDPFETQKSAESAIIEDSIIDRIRASGSTSRANTPDLPAASGGGNVRSRQNTTSSLPTLRKSSQDYLLASRYSANSSPRTTSQKNYYLNPSYQSGDNVADEVERSFGRRDNSHSNTLSPSSQSGGGIAMSKPDSLPLPPVGNVASSKDDYYLGEAEEEQTENNGADNNNDNDDDDDDDEAAALFYEQLKKNTINPLATNKLKPSSSSLLMSNKRPQTHTTPSSNSSVDLTASDKAKKRKEIIGQAAADRLHHTATIMKQKKDMLQRKAAHEETLKLNDCRFVLNKQSQKLAEGLSSRKAGGDIASRLYNEAKELRAKANTTAVEISNQQDGNWSCAQCGTFHLIRSNIDPKSKWGNISYICSNCQFDNQEVLTTHSFCPVNIGLKYNSEVKKAVLQSRQQELQQAGSDSCISSSSSAVSIHEHLYQTGKQREKILKFNQELWLELQAAMPFHPSIPASSKAMINQYLTNDTDSDSISGAQHAAVGDKFHARLTGHKIKEYFAKPTIERLVNTQTRSTIDEAIKHASQFEVVVNNEGKLLKEKKKSFIDRLTYADPRDKAEKQKALESKYAYTFTPTVPPIADGILCGQQLPTNKNNKAVIWEVLNRKNAESKSKLLSQQKKEVEKMLQELQQNQVKALPESNEILQVAMQRHIEELFCLLLASTSSANEAVSETAEVGLDHLEDKNETAAPLPSSNKIIQQSKQIINFQSQSLDLLLVNPELMINEVSTLLLDMQKVKFRHWQKTRVMTADNNDNNNSNSSVPKSLSVTFQEFKDLAVKCIRHRNGPGKGYIYAPKKQPDVALQMQNIAQQQETFQPVIDVTSQEMTKARQEAYKHRPIEEILISEGEKLRLKMDIERQKQSMKEEHKYSFKPKLFKPAANVIPRYRGMSSSDDHDPEHDDEYVETHPLHTTIATLNNSMVARSLSPSPTMQQSKQQLESKSHSKSPQRQALTPPATASNADCQANSLEVALHTPYHIRMGSLDSASATSSSAFKPTALSLDDDDDDENHDTTNQVIKQSVMSLSLDLDDNSGLHQPPVSLHKDSKTTQSSFALSSLSSALPARKMKFNRSHVPNGQQQQHQQLSGIIANKSSSNDDGHNHGAGSRASSSSPTMMTMDSSVVSDITNEHQSAALRSHPSLSISQPQQQPMSASLPRSASSESGKMKQQQQQQQNLKQSRLLSSNQRRVSATNASSGIAPSIGGNNNGNKKGSQPPPLPAELLRDQQHNNEKKSAASHGHRGHGHHHKKSSSPPPPPPFLLYDDQQGAQQLRLSVDSEGSGGNMSALTGSTALNSR